MKRAALLVIDMQKGFDLPSFWEGERNNPDAEENALSLLSAWREADLPRAIIQHRSHSARSPFAPDCEGFALKEGFQPQQGDKHIVKGENSAFIGTDLEVWLRRAEIRDLVICGATTQHCVSTTVRMAQNLGFKVSLIGDACFAMPHGGLDAQTIHDVELTILSGEFASIQSAQKVSALGMAA